jgi:hypothetical protein
MTSIKTRIGIHSLLAKGYPLQTQIGSPGHINIRIDDQENDDCYPGFCDISLKMSDPNSSEFILTLSNVPFDDDVKELAAELDGTWDQSRYGERLTLELSVSQFTAISELATTIRNVVGRGRRYDDPNWKWIARRTARSLERLAKVLSKVK